MLTCTGCGSTWTSADLAAAKARDPRILSCCPESRMVQLCDDCPPEDHPTDKTRCLPCPRRLPVPVTDA